MNVSSIGSFGYNFNVPRGKESVKINFGNHSDEIYLTSRNNNLNDLEYEMTHNELTRCKNPKTQISSSILSLKRMLERNT